MENKELENWNARKIYFIDQLAAHRDLLPVKFDSNLTRNSQIKGMITLTL